LEKEDSICDFADCHIFDFLPLTPYSTEDMHYLYFPDPSVKRNNTYLVKFERKSFRDNSYKQDWIRLSFSLQPDDIVSRDVYNKWIFLSTKDTTYIVEMDYGNDDNSLNFLNYKLTALPQAGFSDTTFRFICNEACQVPGMFAFKRSIETTNWTMTDSSTVLDFSDLDRLSDHYQSSSSHDNPAIVAAARRSDPSCVLYKKKFSLRDLNHDRCNEYYRYSISNGELIDVLCYSFVNNVMRELPREEAIELIKMEADYKALALYTRMGWE
jgi:hypothetical protein